MSKRKILIYDDDARRQDQWKKQLLSVTLIRERFIVECANNKSMLGALKDLEERRAAARKAPSGKTPVFKGLFDDVAILVIDYDLLETDPRMFLTGEAIAYLVRCYSRCGLIIGLNQYGDNIFDLTLRGHPESFGDLNIGSSQLHNRGLWTEPWEGFRPWSWPLVPDAVEKLERRVRGLEGRLDDPILTVLDIPSEVANTLPRSVAEFIEPRKRKSHTSIERTTFRQFVTESGNGLRPKDKLLSDELAARIAAARVSKWLERLVLPGQDIIVDAAHLLSRYPSLLRSGRNRLEAWNKVVTLKSVPKGIQRELIDGYRFKKDSWLSRGAWFWHPLSKDEDIKEVKEPWSSDQPAWVFCEDLSRFLTLKATREFVADLPSPFIRRFVADPGSPSARRVARDSKHIRYRPEVRFSL